MTFLFKWYTDFEIPYLCMPHHFSRIGGIVQNDKLSAPFQGGFFMEKS